VDVNAARVKNGTLFIEVSNAKQVMVLLSAILLGSDSVHLSIPSGDLNLRFSGLPFGR
jgi:hypothetical protein